MYNLAFPDAHSVFESWQRAHPDDPKGPVFDAAAYLFSEFDRLHILQADFFVDDDSFKNLPRQQPDPVIRRKFEATLRRGQELAERRLAIDPGDEDALFANVLRLGLHADYLALILKQEISALGEIKQATAIAEDLLRRDPTDYDAYIAIGTENYLLSLKPAPVRWFLRIGGAKTDKEAGIAKLKLTAASGQFLQPYAELLLAVAALRDDNKTEAIRLLSDLARRFPRNPLYAEEVRKIH
jgi:hypothetical protein